VKKKIIIIVFALTFVGVGVFVYIGQNNRKSDGLFYSGTIETTQAKLSFQVPGRVAEVKVQEGQPVAKNQIIASLDRAEFESRYEQARANLDRAEKTKQQLITALQISQRTLPAEVARAQAGVNSARDSLADAEKNYQRYEELFRQSVVTEKERDTLKLGYDVAKSRLAESESLLKLAEGNLGRIEAAKDDITTAGAQIDVARAALNQAAIQLGYTQLISPQDGVVVSRNIEAGETVNVGREVITVADLIIERRLVDPGTHGNFIHVRPAVTFLREYRPRRIDDFFSRFAWLFHIDYPGCRIRIFNNLIPIPEKSNPSGSLSSGPIINPLAASHGE